MQFQKVYEQLVKRIPLVDRLLPKHSNFKRFIILGHARTGSNFLMAGLKSNPGIKIYGEVLAAHIRTIGEGFDPIMENVFVPVNRWVTHVGFKVFYYHVSDEELDKLLNMKDLKVIHLTRENKLRTIISLDRAKFTDQWTATSENKNQPITLQTQDLIDRIKRIEQYEAEFDSVFSEHELIKVSYESLIDDPESNFEKLSAFLKTGSLFPQAIKLKKQGGTHLENDLINHAEVRDILAGSPYAMYSEQY